MPAINFPNSPVNDQIYVVNNISYIYKSATNAWSFLPQPFADSFTDLTDTPELYTDQAGKIVLVNDTEDGLEFGDLPDGVSAFAALTDTPAGYTDQAGKIVLVNDTEDGLEFGNLPEGGGGGADSYVKTYFYEGALQENVSVKRFYIHIASTLESITVNLGAAGQTPTQIQIKKNNQILNTMTIDANTTYQVLSVSHALEINDFLTVDITRSSSAANLYVTFVYRE
jgi:hypothetical protein